MSLVRICNGECAVTVGDFSIVLGEIVGSLDKEILDCSVDACIDISRLYAAINSRAHGS